MLSSDRSSHIGRRLTIVAAVILAIVACGIPSAAPSGAALTPTAAPGTPVQITPIHWEGSIIADVASLRAEPRSDAQQIGRLVRGDGVVVVGTSPDNGWYLVTLPGAQNGMQQAWVLASFVTFTTSTPVPTSVVTPSTTPTATPPPATPTATLPPGYAALRSDVTDASWDVAPDPNVPGSRFVLSAGTPYRYQGERQDDRCRLDLLPPANQPGVIPQPWVPCGSIEEAETPEPSPIDNEPLPSADTLTSSPVMPTSVPPSTPTDTPKPFLPTDTPPPPSTPTNTPKRNLPREVLPFVPTDTPPPAVPSVMPLVTRLSL